MVHRGLILLGALLAASACGSNGNKAAPAPAPRQQQTNPEEVRSQDPGNPVLNLTGSYQDLVTQKTESLEQFKDKPLVLFLATDMCITCSEEAKAFKAHVNQRNLKLSNVDVLTILVGSYYEDADYWQVGVPGDEGHKVPWKVGYQPGDNGTLIRQYCKEETTPCTVVTMPGKGVVLAKTGMVEPAEIERLTGEWK